jgi:hypothetical protein
MKNTSVIPNRLLPRNAVDLGRLVLHPKAPEQDFYDPIIANKQDPIINPADILVQHQYNFSHLLSLTSGSKLHVFLASILGLDNATESSNMSCVDSFRRSIYTLANTSEIFKRICSSNNAARQYLEKAYSRGRAVYMVVGLQTLLDAKLTEHTTTSSKKGTDITVPVALAVTATTGVPIPLGDILDSGVKAEWLKGNKALGMFLAQGEQVYAVQYRKIEFRWFSSGKVSEGATLREGAVWKSFWTRNVGTEDEFEVDSVEARVDDQLEKSALGPESEIFSDGEEEILFDPK